MLKLWHRKSPGNQVTLPPYNSCSGTVCCLEMHHSVCLKMKIQFVVLVSWLFLILKPVVIKINFLAILLVYLKSNPG